MSEKNKSAEVQKRKSRKSITAEFPPKWNFASIGDTLQFKAWKREQTVIDGREANFLIATLLSGDKVSVPLGANLKKVIENLDETLMNESELAEGIKIHELFIELKYVKDIPSKFKSNPTKIFKCDILEY